MLISFDISRNTAITMPDNHNPPRKATSISHNTLPLSQIQQSPKSFIDRSVRPSYLTTSLLHVQRSEELKIRHDRSPHARSMRVRCLQRLQDLVQKESDRDPLLPPCICQQRTIQVFGMQLRAQIDQLHQEQKQPTSDSSGDTIRWSGSCKRNSV